MHQQSKNIFWYELADIWKIRNWNIVDRLGRRAFNYEHQKTAFANIKPVYCKVLYQLQTNLLRMHKCLFPFETDQLIFHLRPFCKPNAQRFHRRIEAFHNKILSFHRYHHARKKSTAFCKTYLAFSIWKFLQVCSSSLSIHVVLFNLTDSHRSTFFLGSVSIFIER